jgi:hypothetical protein
VENDEELFFAMAGLDGYELFATNYLLQTAILTKKRPFFPTDAKWF